MVRSSSHKALAGPRRKNPDPSRSRPLEPGVGSGTFLMVPAHPGDDPGDMTETPQQTQPPGPQPGPTAPPPGWNTHNLKDYRQLRRSRLDRKVAGVAGGLARHLDVDPTIIRVLFVVLVLFGGAGLLLYGALWLLVPEEGSERTVFSTSEATRNTLLIIALVVAGLIAIGNGLHGFGYPWLIAGALVVAAVLVTRDRNHSAPPPPQPPTPWSSAPPPPPQATTTWSSAPPAPSQATTTWSSAPPASVAAPHTQAAPGSPVPPPPPGAPPGGAWQPAPPRRP